MPKPDCIALLNTCRKVATQLRSGDCIDIADTIRNREPPESLAAQARVEEETEKTVFITFAESCKHALYELSSFSRSTSSREA